MEKYKSQKQISQIIAYKISEKHSCMNIKSNNDADDKNKTTNNPKTSSKDKE